MKKLPTDYQNFISTSRYAKWRDDLGRREYWNETVERYFEFFTQHLLAKHSFDMPVDQRQELLSAVQDLDIMPSMRCLMSAGAALERCNVAGYNCSYVPIDHPRAFDEILYILMCGTGVGFSVEKHNTEQLPIVNEHFEKSNTVISVEDSKAGWARAFRELVAMLYSGQIPTWDLSKLRPAGARLKTFGGRSSGPEPLNRLFDFTVDVFKNAAGRKLTSLECHDIICKVGEVVVVGGVRRSALISLSDLSDGQMRDAKSGNWWQTEAQRTLANNSAVYQGKPDIFTFLDEWTSLAKSGSGERGIFNREASRKQIPERRDDDFIWGTNPSLRKGTKVWTSEGILPIEELENKEFFVTNLNGTISKAKCWLSGNSKPLYKITLNTGAEIYATAEHKWPIKTNDNVYEKYATDCLAPGMKLPISVMSKLTNGTTGSRDDGFIIGWNLGDGWQTQRDNGLQIGFAVYDSKRQSNIHNKIADYLKEICKWEGSFDDKSEINVNNNILRNVFSKFGVQHKKLGLPVSVWTHASESFRRGLIDGIFSSDAYVSSSEISLISANKTFLDEVQKLLAFYGIQGSVLKRKINNPKFPNGKKYDKEYTSYRYRIKAKGSLYRFAQLFTLSHGEKQKQLDLIEEKALKTYVKIKNVELTTLREDVWDITVYDNTHSFVIEHCITGNCSEIILRPYQFCNLCEVVVRPDDSLEDLKHKVRLATILGTFQSTLTNFKYLRRIWKNNTEAERLLGVSLTGITDHPVLKHTKSSADWFTEMKETAIVTNKEYADILGIPQSSAITCVKPSGTVSQLVDSSSGIHARYSQYYIRTVRADAKDPLTQFLISQGVPHEEDLFNKQNIVFSFPMKSPDTATLRDDMTAIEQLELWKHVQDNWCEHKPSATIYVKSSEWLEVGAWVYKHFNSISGVSFLPHSEHVYQQAPYQEITKDEYEDWLKRMPTEIQWEKLSEFEKDDYTTGTQELSCSAGHCEIN